VGLKPKNANWKQVYDDLNAEIKIRHYSPKTLKAYKGWVRPLTLFYLGKVGTRNVERDRDKLTY
jgi:hypothetical protein